MKSQYLSEVKLLKNKVTSFDRFPYSLPLLQNFESLRFHPNVTYLVGENGSGKSTLLEAIAIAWGFNPEGGTLNFNFNTRISHSDLWRNISLIRGFKRPKDGFFLRAESFYNLATNIDQLDEEPSFGPPIKDSYGGVSLHKQSHGESFFSLMLHRFGSNGLYILDEPEAALSPSRQIAMLSRMHELVQANSQFIVATHSPILMSYPNSHILEIADSKIRLVDYEDTDHFQTTKLFINSYKKILEELVQI